MDKVSELQQLLDRYADKRVVVVGTTCTGKSTFLKAIPNAHDMDELVFPLLTQEEADYVCQTPWTEEIGQTMTLLTKERVKVVPGEPVFGTVVLDADIVIYLKISDELLRERARLRSTNFQDAKNMQVQIEEELKRVNVPIIDFPVG